MTPTGFLFTDQCLTVKEIEALRELWERVYSKNPRSFMMGNIRFEYRPFTEAVK